MHRLASTALLLSLSLVIAPAAHSLSSLTQSSFSFAALGNTGTGDKAQYELAEQMANVHGRFNYRTVLLLGNNIQGTERPQDYVRKFEAPYRRLLDQGVEFRAALGNHDSREQRFYKLFNMRGQAYYTFSPAPDVQFFALESTYFSSEQLGWLADQLKQSAHPWKVVFLHHSPYSSGRRHGSDVRLRTQLEPLFLQSKVSVVFSAGDTSYERITPQNDIAYFVVGSGGTVRRENIDRSSGLTATGFDEDLAFLTADIQGDTMRFTVISRTGQTVDSGQVARRK